ncbi:hypothetical protein [Campylobacter lanienae]|uniref:hypothetical protein n=1 Tax=Campylobacter lanienae TaxID=75658 RepID=UPI0015D6E839|nr:hypothetical protein [Campylobacter lanienae]
MQIQTTGRGYGGVFDKICIYTEASLPIKFREDFKDKFFVGKGNNYTPTWNGKDSSDFNGFMPTRGFGYWCWKPKVILMTLEQMNDNDILLFVDIGCEFNYSKANDMTQMLKQVDKNEFMGVLHNALNKNYQKGDTLKHFGLTNDENFLNSKQVLGGLLFMKKNKKTLSIINEWMDIFYNNFNFVDDTPSLYENHKDFIRNLHDQSVLNAIMYKYQCVNFPIEYYFDRYNKPILCRRNLIYLSNNVKDTEYFNSLFTTYPKSETQPGAKVKVKEFIDKYQILYKNEQTFKLQLQQAQKTINSLNKQIDSLPIKKQSLEISNLEQDLINKKLKAHILEKELGYDCNAIQENKKLKEQIKALQLIGKENIKQQIINTAKSRIHNQLSYKLGKAMIENSKSIWGYIRMPYVLSYIKDMHKKEQIAYNEKIKANPSLKLPPLESYPDYNEAIKIKEHLSYKLGEALIKASRDWYKGGYIKFIFDMKRIKNR